MAGVDNRIVTMKFDNRDFETNARTSMSTLQKLKESINFGAIAGGTVRTLGMIDSALQKVGLRNPFSAMIQGANRGLGLVGGLLDRLGMKNPFSSSVQGASDLQKAAQDAGGPGGMGVLEGGVTSVSNKFLMLSTIAITALSNITNKIVNSTTTWLKSFTFAPVMDGLREYELNLQSIQTVQANTDQPLDKINASLDELNNYSDKTIYNFAEMARNVGTFTAAGVNLETSVSSIKGIANLAALSGSNSQQAATAMYQLSQAIAAGKVGLMDWNSVVNAGMGGKKLQTALANTAVAMGQLDASAVKMEGPMKKLTIHGKSFRESIMAGPGNEAWLTSDALVNTLAVMDGRFSKAALASEKTAEGVRKYTDAQLDAVIADNRAAMEKKNGVKYTDAQFKSLQRMSEMAFKSAQEVKTLGQVFDIAKETIASGWSASFRNIFGDLKEAKKLFTGMSEGLNAIIEENALARNKMLVAWKEGGGRLAIIEGLKNVWSSFYEIIKAVGKGFRDIFPKTSADNLISMSKSFQEFTKKLIPGEKTLAKIRDIAGGVTSIFSIIKTVIGGVVSGFKTMFSAVGGGNGNFLSFVAGIGRALKAFDAFLKESGLVTAFFNTLGKILSIPLAVLQGLAGAFGNIFSGFSTSEGTKVGDTIGGVGDKLSGLQVIGEKIRSFFQKLGKIFSGIGKTIGGAIVKIGDLIAGMFTPETFTKTLDVVQTGLIGGILLILKKFFSGGITFDLTGGLFDGIKETLGAATGAFESMQMKLKADLLFKLALAIGAMALSLLILSSIDAKSLAKALGAMTTGFGILIGALAVLFKTLGKAGVVQLYIVTSAFTKLAVSMLLLAFALKVLASLSFGEIIKGLLGLAGMMFILNKAMVPLAAGSKGMGRAAFSILVMSAALVILSVALKILASMSWEELGRGLLGLAGAFVILAAAIKIMPPLQAEALALLALGLALNMIAVAMKVFGSMSLTEIAKGLLALGASLWIIGKAISTMPKNMIFQAVALLAVSAALVLMSGALTVMGKLGWEEIAKGLIVLAGALIIIAAGLQAIGLVGTIGAIGLIAAVGALTLLVPVLTALGIMSWEMILKGLVGLAGVFTLIGVAGYLLAPVVPIILAIGAAMLLMGAGLFLAGSGALAAATAFGIFVGAGLAGIGIVIEFLKSLIMLIPQTMAAVGEGIVAMIVAIGQGAPKIASAFGRLLSNMLDVIIKNVPKIGRLFTTLITTAIKVIVTLTPKIVDAGFKLIISFLQAIDKNIGRIVHLAVNIVTKFIDGIADNLDRIIQSGVNFIIKFIDGVTEAIENNSTRVGESGAKLGIALVKGIAKAIAGGGGIIKDAAMDAARNAWKAAKEFFGIHSPSKLMFDTVGVPIVQGWALGIRKSSGQVADELSGVGKNAMTKLERTMKDVSDKVKLDPNMNPVVRPVLDLSQVAKDAKQMGSLMGVPDVRPNTSLNKASDISVKMDADEAAGLGTGRNRSGDTYVTLEQHNHSPKALDHIALYREGKSLISLAKETLR